MIQILALVWAASAVIAWEVQAESLRGPDRWLAITIGSLMPVYNTLVAWSCARDSLKNWKRWKR